MSEYLAGKSLRDDILYKTGMAVGENYARASRDGDRGVGRSRLSYDNAAIVFENFTYLSGTTLKLAQSLSMDTGILPGEFIQVMAQAQYRVSSMNRALVRAQIRRELGRPPADLFSRFDDTAVAVGSIGQVHGDEDCDGRPLFRGEDPDVYLNEIRTKLLEETGQLQEGRYLELFAGL